MTCSCSWICLSKVRDCWNRGGSLGLVVLRISMIKQKKYSKHYPVSEGAWRSFFVGSIFCYFLNEETSCTEYMLEHSPTMPLLCFTSSSARQVSSHSPRVEVPNTGSRLGVALRFCACNKTALLSHLTCPPLHNQLTILFYVDPLQGRKHCLMAPARLIHMYDILIQAC